MSLKVRNELISNLIKKCLLLISAVLLTRFFAVNFRSHRVTSMNSFF